MSDGEVALPAGVGRVDRGEALEDGEGFAERGQRLVQPALRLQDVADLGMSDGELALPAALDGSIEARRWKMARNSRNAANASSSRPCACKMSPTLE